MFVDTFFFLGGGRLGSVSGALVKRLCYKCLFHLWVHKKWALLPVSVARKSVATEILVREGGQREGRAGGGRSALCEIMELLFYISYKNMSFLSWKNVIFHNLDFNEKCVFPFTADINKKCWSYTKTKGFRKHTLDTPNNMTFKYTCKFYSNAARSN